MKGLSKLLERTGACSQCRCRRATRSGEPHALESALYGALVSCDFTHGSAVRTSGGAAYMWGMGRAQGEKQGAKGAPASSSRAALTLCSVRRPTRWRLHASSSFLVTYGRGARRGCFCDLAALACAAAHDSSGRLVQLG